MNLVEKLLTVEKEEVEKKEEKEVYSPRLSKLLKSETKIKIREIGIQKLNWLTRRLINESGNFSLEKRLEVYADVVVAGVLEPNLKEKELQKHFGAANARELAIKLLKEEVFELGDEIMNLGKERREEEEEEVKN